MFESCELQAARRDERSKRIRYNGCTHLWTPLTGHRGRACHTRFPTRLVVVPSVTERLWWLRPGSFYITVRLTQACPRGRRGTIEFEHFISLLELLLQFYVCCAMSSSASTINMPRRSTRSMQTGTRGVSPNGCISFHSAPLRSKTIGETHVFSASPAHPLLCCLSPQTQASLINQQ